MGIDVYLRWDGQTEAERKAQYCGFDIHKGHVGYLREAYHGGPYATEALVPEGWLDDPFEAPDGVEVTDEGLIIPAVLLYARLPRVLEVAKERELKVYKNRLADGDPTLKSFSDFVELHSRLEAEGRRPRILVSA